MPTNPIGANNAIIQSCVKADIRSDLGRLAFQRGLTVSKMVAELVEERVRAARLRGVITDRAQQSLQLGLSLAFGLGIGFAGLASVFGDNELRNVRRISRRKTETVELICEV